MQLHETRAGHREVTDGGEQPTSHRGRVVALREPFGVHGRPVEPAVVAGVAGLGRPVGIRRQAHLVPHPQHRDAAPSQHERVRQGEAPDGQVDGRGIDRPFSLDKRRERRRHAADAASWQRRWQVHAVVVGTGGRDYSAAAASRASRLASIDQICTISVLWYARSLTLPWWRPVPR